MRTRRFASPTTQIDEAGAREHFVDAALYDFEYRRRRADVNFYRRLAEDRARHFTPGPILDLGCGTGRILVPLLRDGHAVVGLDRSPQMLARASARVRRLSAVRQRRALLLRADLRTLAFYPRFALAIVAFHGIQHLYTTQDLRRFLRALRESLLPDGWIAFDVLPPDPEWLSRDSTRRWARTRFTHPITGEKLVYSTNHTYAARRRVLSMNLYYQPVDADGRACAPERTVHLSHRQLAPIEVQAMLAAAGFKLMATFGGFDGRAIDDEGPNTSDEHIYVARRTGAPAKALARR